MDAGQKTDQLARSHGRLEQKIRERTAELERERHLLQSLMDYLPDCIYFKDKLSQFVRVNRAMAARFGSTAPETIVGKTDFDFFAKEHAQMAFDDEQQVIATGEPVVAKEEKETWPDGHVTWASTTKVPLRDETGQIVGTFGISRDITERKLGEQQLARYARELSLKNAQIEDDLAMAREVQMAFLPSHYPSFPPHVEVEKSALRFCHRYLAAEALGGDFFEVLQLSDTEAGIFVCDVMGHGMRAALVMAIIRGLVDEVRTFAGDPGQLLTELNLALLKNLREARTTVFASACYMTIDTKTGRLLSANAGHPSPIWLHRQSGRAEWLVPAVTARGPALGLSDDVIYTTADRTLAPGDCLLLYTDGLYEVEGEDEQNFGQDRLLEVIRDRLHMPESDLMEAVIVEAQKYSKTGSFSDDVCVVGVELTHLLTDRPDAEPAPEAASPSR